MAAIIGGVLILLAERLQNINTTNEIENIGVRDFGFHRRFDVIENFLIPRERRNLLDVPAMLSAIRRERHAERDSLVEPRSSATVAVPIVVDDEVLATAGMTYFKSAVRPEEIVARYVPLVAALGRSTATSVQSLR